MEKVYNIKYCVCEKHTALLQFCFPNMTFPSMLQLFLIFFGTGFEVLKVVRIHKRSVLGNRILWYMVISVFEEYSGCIFAGCGEMGAICAELKLSTHQSDYTAP